MYEISCLHRQKTAVFYLSNFKAKMVLKLLYSLRNLFYYEITVNINASLCFLIVA